MLDKYVFISDNYVLLTWYRVASGKGIAGVPVTTSTKRVMISYVAFGIKTTYAGARIDAFLIDTCLVKRTFARNGAFRATVWWGANECW